MADSAGVRGLNEPEDQSNEPQQRSRSPQVMHTQVWNLCEKTKIVDTKETKFTKRNCPCCRNLGLGHNGRMLCHTTSQCHLGRWEYSGLLLPWHLGPLQLVQLDLISTDQHTLLHLVASSPNHRSHIQTQLSRLHSVRMRQIQGLQDRQLRSRGTEALRNRRLQQFLISVLSKL